MKKLVKVTIDGEEYFKEIDDPTLEKDSQETWNIKTDELKKELSKIITMLPFMEDEQLHQISEAIIKGEKDYENIPLEYVMPFLEEEDCDKIFLKSIQEKKNITTLAPFVSEKVLHNVVEKVLNGELEDLKLDTLYPFLSSQDIKLLFDYLLKKN
ncbi:MAG: hypothetical protein LBM99_03200 [Bacillales bacterium]|jgi:hypothetical protein|nr:hypothetical protein [Bacillales bacterium]